MVTSNLRFGDSIQAAGFDLFRRPSCFVHNPGHVKSVTIQINDLFEFEGQPVPAQRPDNAVVEAMARRQFEFLRQPLQIEIGENTVTVSFAEESPNAQDEAGRLAERAAKRAAEGNYDKAISLWKRVLELNPSFHKARRDLAMSCMETGDIEGAKNHLIEVLRLNPGDAWGWVVLGNLYAKNEKDWATAEKFLRRALEIAPNDSWALNGLAAMTAQRGQTEEAVKLFEQAISSNPELPNPYYGLGFTFQRTGQLVLSARALDRLFLKARMQDARSKHVFDQARTLYGAVQDELVKQQHSDAFKAVENFRAGLEQLSGYPVRVTDGEFKDKTSATIQMAWKHGRDHHLITFRSSLPEDLRTHQMAHELSHLQLEAEARKAGKNRFFATTGKTEQSALQRLENDIRNLQRKGFPADASQGFDDGAHTWVGGLPVQLPARHADRNPAAGADACPGVNPVRCIADGRPGCLGLEQSSPSTGSNAEAHSAGGPCPERSVLPVPGRSLPGSLQLRRPLPTVGSVPALTAAVPALAEPVIRSLAPAMNTPSWMSLPK